MPWFSKMEPLTKCIFLLMDEEHMNTSMLSLLGKKTYSYESIFSHNWAIYLFSLWMLQEYAGGCRSMQKRAEAWRILQGGAGACRSMQEYAEMWRNM